MIDINFPLLSLLYGYLYTLIQSSDGGSQPRGGPRGGESVRSVTQGGEK